MPTYTISKDFDFCASHQLVYLAETQPDHKCARLHGHNYVVRVEITSHKLNDDGFVIDYNELKWFKEYLDDQFDHRHLNEALIDPSGRTTTAEALARLFYNVVDGWLNDFRPCSLRVGVSETPKTFAWFDKHGQ